MTVAVGALKLVIGILCVFTAISLLCAVRIGSRRALIGDSTNPYCGVPGFTAEQLQKFSKPSHRSAGVALRSDADGGGLNPIPSGPTSISTSRRGRA